MLNKEIPFIRIVIPLCGGIISGLFMVPGYPFYIISGSSLLLVFIISLFFNRRVVNRLYGVAMFSAFFLCGLFLYSREKERLTTLSQEEALFSGCLSDYPEEKENSSRMILRLNTKVSGEEKRKINGSLLLYCRNKSGLPDLAPGDLLTIRCTPREIVNRGNPKEFNYRFYMQCNGIKYTAFIEPGDIIDHSVPRHRRPVYLALMIRERIVTIFREMGISGERLALVAAITLGQKNMLEQEQKQHFVKAGVMHIMAVSGLHVVILSMFVFRMLFFLKGRLNIVRVIVTIVLLWVFAFITGLTPSVLRATIMYSFLQAGKIMNRPVNGMNSVLASAFILIIARPSVIFDSGFLLSYAAVAAIVMFYRDFYQKIHFKRRIPDFLWQSVVVTILAQAGTLPLTVMLFNRFPAWFIISNLIIVPLSSLVVITGILVPLTFPIRFLSLSLARALDFMTGLTERLTEITSSLPYSSIENIGINTPECIILTITIFISIRYLIDRKSVSVLYPICSILLLTIVGTAGEFKTRRSAELVVYNSYGYTSIGIRNGHILTLISDSLPKGREISRHSDMLNLKVSEESYKGTPMLVTAGRKKILVTSILTSQILESSTPEYVIITGNEPFIQKNIKPLKHPEVVIFGPEISSSFRMLREISAFKSSRLYFVDKQGAFILNL